MFQHAALVAYDLRRLASALLGQRRRKGKGSALPPSPQRIAEARHWRRHPLDDASCALVASSTMVTLMFYALNAVTKGGMIEGGREGRPDWLSALLHQGNVAVAFVELVLASLYARTEDSGGTADKYKIKCGFGMKRERGRLLLSGIGFGVRAENSFSLVCVITFFLTPSSNTPY